MGQILTKTVILLKMCHIQLNYAFLLFWSVFGEIHWRLLFLVKKVTSQEEALNILETFFSQQVWKGANPEENLDLL